MDERYEIRGKIGQGGIGAVYRAYDKNLSREVAIKRILPEGGVDLEKEATRQLTKEAGALSALQHPHIVTIYDVGIDEDGPYVVMELLHGKTIDEVVEKASLTWPDFREFAMQTQEALIAAQDMNIVHRDLKPTNVMLTWLPSGKFQVKIVDFGLAKFSPKPSLQTIDQKDSIFGSIFFMSPEQFERIELDTRTDMYSIGCVYYYALTGVHPFNGETGPQVMVAHLDHRVFPLHEIRPDLPRWVSDWVMWHINRKTEHRPNNARESLSFFIQSDANTPSNSFQASAQDTVTPANLMPAMAAGINPNMSAMIKTAPQPILPPESFGRVSVHTTSQPKMIDSGEFVAAPNAPVPAAIVTPNTPPVPIAVALPEPTPELSQILHPAPLTSTSETVASNTQPPAVAVPEPTPLVSSATPINTNNMSENTPPKPKPRLLIPSSKPPAETPEIITPVAVTAPVIVTPIESVEPAVVEVVAPPVVTPVVASPIIEAPPVVAPAIVKPALQAGPTPLQIARPVATAQVATKPQTVPLQISSPTQATAPPSMVRPAPAMQRPGLTRPAAAPAQDRPTTQLSTTGPVQKKGLSNGAKAAIATTLGLIVVCLIIYLLSSNSESKTNVRYNQLVAQAADATIKELPVNAADLDILLNAATTISVANSRETVYKALYIAKSTDGNDVDTVIADFITKAAIPEDIRANILKRVLGGRKNPVVLGTLINFVKSNPKPESAAAALEAARTMAQEKDVPEFLSIIQFSNDTSIRLRCEEALVTLIKKSSNPKSFSDNITPAYESASSPEVKQGLLRILGATGSDSAKAAILGGLKGSEKTMQISSANASKNWPDDTLFEEVMDILSENTDDTVRPRIFGAAREFLLLESKRDDASSEELWRMLSKNAKTDEEQEAVIRALSNNTADWAMVVVEYFQDKAESDRVIDLAGKALDRMRSKARLAPKKDEDEEDKKDDKKTEEEK